MSQSWPQMTLILGNPFKNRKQLFTLPTKLTLPLNDWWFGPWSGPLFGARPIFRIAQLDAIFVHRLAPVQESQKRPGTHKKTCGQVFFWNMEELCYVTFQSRSAVSAKFPMGFLVFNCFFVTSFLSREVTNWTCIYHQGLFGKNNSFASLSGRKNEGPKKVHFSFVVTAGAVACCEQKPMSRDWPTGGEGLSFVVLHLAEFTWGHTRGLHGWWWWWWWWRRRSWW